MGLFRNFGVPELVLILLLALIIFGPGRIARLGSELGKGIRGFKDGIKGEDEDAKEGEEKADTSDSKEA
jgi:sec-independent protein translocase protein TatA